MNNALASFSLSFLFLLLTGCSTPQGSTTEAIKYRTFSVAELPMARSALDPSATERLNSTLRAAIVEALTSKGYQETTPPQSDFQVKVYTEFYTDGITPESEQRVLAITMYDAKNNMDIWRTSRGRSSRESLNPEVLRKNVLEMLSSIRDVSEQ